MYFDILRRLTSRSHNLELISTVIASGGQCDMNRMRTATAGKTKQIQTAHRFPIAPIHMISEGLLQFACRVQ